MTWHFSCVTGLLELYTGFPPQVTARVKGNFSLPENWLAGWIFCLVCKTHCLFGRALLPVSPAAVPMQVPCGSHCPGKALWCAARQSCERYCVTGLQRGAVAGPDTQDPSPSQGTTAQPLNIHTVAQIGGDHYHLFGDGWVISPCWDGWGCQGTWGHPASPAKPL